MRIKINAIEIRNLSKSFRGMYAVDNLSMIVPVGALVENTGCFPSSTVKGQKFVFYPPHHTCGALEVDYNFERVVLQFKNF